MSPHREVLTRLVQQHGWTRGAELGVDKGILFGLLLRECPALHLLGVDTFPDHARSHRAFELAQTYAERATLLTLTTHDAAVCVVDGSLDFVFIDADHREPAVADDIAQWALKVRAGGWLGGHDYNRKFPGVVQAVDRVFGPAVKTWGGSIWGVWR